MLGQIEEAAYKSSGLPGRYLPQILQDIQDKKEVGDDDKIIDGTGKVYHARNLDPSSKSAPLSIGKDFDWLKVIYQHGNLPGGSRSASIYIAKINHEPE